MSPPASRSARVRRRGEQVRQAVPSPANHLAPAATVGVCADCGARLLSWQGCCPSCGGRSIYGERQARQQVSGSKDKTAAALLAFFLGGFGAHHFYLGSPLLGIFYLMFCWTLIPSVLSFIEFLIFLAMSEANFHAKYG